VTTACFGYKRKAQFTDENLGEKRWTCPPTLSRRWRCGSTCREDNCGINSEQLDFAGALHAAEHAAIGICRCSHYATGRHRRGIHRFSLRYRQAADFHPRRAPGRRGIAEKGFELIEQLWQVTLETIKECPCQEGCPSCIQSPKCGNNNKPLDKKAARILLEGLLSKINSVLSFLSPSEV